MNGLMQTRSLSKQAWPSTRGQKWMAVWMLVTPCATSRLIYLRCSVWATLAQQDLSEADNDNEEVPGRSHARSHTGPPPQQPKGTPRSFLITIGLVGQPNVCL